MSDRLVFVDVGAHEGQTLGEAIDPRYGFTDVYALEPMPAEFARMQGTYSQVTSPEIHFCNYGLAGSAGPRNMYGSNVALESSMFAEKDDVDESVVTLCDFEDASEWFASNIGVNDRVFLKINAEGAEVEIIDSLLDTGEIWTVEAMLVDFDIRKVPGREHEENRIKRRLDEEGFKEWFNGLDLVGNEHGVRIASWLDRVLT